MFAHAILAAIAVRERTRRPKHGRTLVPLSVNEIRHLFAKLITTAIRSLSYWLHWSAWRRRHQHTALTSHYARRGHDPDRHPSL
jgi:hypothetical protein